jgi:hypothetical protein
VALRRRRSTRRAASIDSINTRCDPPMVRIVFNVPARIR